MRTSSGPTTARPGCNAARHRDDEPSTRRFIEWRRSAGRAGCVDDTHGRPRGAGGRRRRRRRHRGCLRLRGLPRRLRRGAGGRGHSRHAGERGRGRLPAERGRRRMERSRPCRPAAGRVAASPGRRRGDGVGAARGRSTGPGDRSPDGLRTHRAAVHRAGDSHPGGGANHGPGGRVGRQPQPARSRRDGRHRGQPGRTDMCRTGRPRRTAAGGIRGGIRRGRGGGVDADCRAHRRARPRARRRRSRLGPRGRTGGGGQSALRGGDARSPPDTRYGRR